MYNTFDTLKPPVIYSVSEINKMVSVTLLEAFLPLKVSGEVSNFSAPGTSGHWYFVLKDKKAQVRCVFFDAKNRASGLMLKDGMQVVAQARLRLYEVRGDFQLNIESLERAGDGLLQQQFEALKARLAKEGLFDAPLKKPLPTQIRRVGIITSPTGAAIKDVLTVFNRRFPLLQIIIYPALVQGEQAKSAIVKQIMLANQRQECDALLLTRGGGSLEDLWPFNEEMVARAISESQLPIVSAIGHEIDFTIADFVADLRAPTPSAAAELMSPDQLALGYRIEDLKSRLNRHIQHSLAASQQQLNHLMHRLRHPRERLDNMWQQLDEQERRLKKAMLQLWQTSFQKYQYLLKTLETLSPLATLQRGYALIRREKTKRLVTNSREVRSGDRVYALLGKGELVCRVEEARTVVTEMEPGGVEPPTS